MEESNQSILENAIESYHNAIENKSSGFLIIASFTSICKWLRYEKEFNNIETWRIARTICWSIFMNPDTYNLNVDSLQEANAAGIHLANAYNETGEIEKGFTFRSFIKKLNVFELNPQETGDLILCLLLQRVIVEHNEDESVQKKYMEDIESICNDQLEGQSIYNDSLEMANKIYQEYRSQSKH